MPLGQFETEKETKKRRASLNLNEKHIEFLEENSISRSELARKIFDYYLSHHENIDKAGEK